MTLEDDHLVIDVTMSGRKVGQLVVDEHVELLMSYTDMKLQIVRSDSGNGPYVTSVELVGSNPSTSPRGRQPDQDVQLPEYIRQRTLPPEL